MPLRLGAVFVAGTVVAGAIASSLIAQTPVQVGPAFEAASIKRNTSGGRSYENFQAGGRFIARNATMRALIGCAFSDPVALAPQQMAGGPSWIETEHFDVEARGSADFPEVSCGSVGTAMGSAMVRALLVDRSRLATHWEQRDLAVYALVRRSDRQPGPRLLTSAGKPGTDCQSATAAAIGDASLSQCGSYLLQNTGGNQFAIHARGITMPDFARNLQNIAGRLVVDRTELAGTFSFDLDFEYRPPSGTGADEGIGAAIFTAVQDQLGLKLDATRAPVNVLVIDHVDQPTAD
jgi:uncharacterized protein (TIGR03435 family)